MERIEHIDSKECKGQKTITIHLKGGNEPRLMLSPQVKYTRLLFFLNGQFILMLILILICFFFMMCCSKPIHLFMHVNVLLLYHSMFFISYIVYAFVYNSLGVCAIFFVLFCFFFFFNEKQNLYQSPIG